MREIKFKFWLGHTKRMTYEHSLIEISHSAWDFTEDIVALQFTGLQDKNGNDIYEGDIVKVPYVTPMGSLTDVEDEDLRTSIGFEHGTFVLLYHKTDHVLISEYCIKKEGVYVSNYGNKTLISSETYLEIIGNIYENPELIKP